MSGLSGQSGRFAPIDVIQESAPDTETAPSQDLVTAGVQGERKEFVPAVLTVPVTTQALHCSQLTDI